MKQQLVMDTSIITTTNETIIRTINNTTLESSKVNNNENKISKLSDVWNNFNKRIR